MARLIYCSDFFHSHWFDIDKTVFQFINGHHSPLFDKIMWIISSNFTGIAFFLVLSLFSIFIFRRKSWKIILIVACAVFVADFFAARVIKPTVKRLRPTHDSDYHEGYDLHIHQRQDGTYYYGGRYSFPSNHAANILTTSILFFYFLKDKLKRRKIWVFALIFFNVLVGYSRSYLAVHYPTDILCGWLLAAVVSGIVIFFVGKANVRV